MPQRAYKDPLLSLCCSFSVDLLHTSQTIITILRHQQSTVRALLHQDIQTRIFTPTYPTSTCISIPPSSSPRSLSLLPLRHRVLNLDVCFHFLVSTPPPPPPRRSFLFSLFFIPMFSSPLELIPRGVLDISEHFQSFSNRRCVLGRRAMLTKVRKTAVLVGRDCAGSEVPDPQCNFGLFQVRLQPILLSFHSVKIGSTNTRNNRG